MDKKSLSLCDVAARSDWRGHKSPAEDMAGRLDAHTKDQGPTRINKSINSEQH